MKDKNQSLVLRNSTELAKNVIDNKPVMNLVCNALNLVAVSSGKELAPEVIKFMAEDCFKVYSHTTLEDHIEAFTRVARSKTYGAITLNSLHEKLAEVEEENCIERERALERKIGYGKFEK